MVVNPSHNQLSYLFRLQWFGILQFFLPGATSGWSGSPKQKTLDQHGLWTNFGLWKIRLLKVNYPDECFKTSVFNIFPARNFSAMFFFKSNIEGEVWMPLGTEMNVWPMRYQSGSGVLLRNGSMGTASYVPTIGETQRLMPMWILGKNLWTWYTISIQTWKR